MLSNIKINEQRLWDSLMEMAKIGGTPKGAATARLLPILTAKGVISSSLGARTQDVRCRSIRWATYLPGAKARIARSTRSSAAVTSTRSPRAGNSTAFSACSRGLEIIRTLNDHNYESDAPIEIAMWTNEEGARFAPAMVASGVYAGLFTEEYGHSRADVDGKTIGGELTRIGYRGETPCGGRPFKAFFEAHIEQGPILEAENKTIGVVTGIQGIRWFECTVNGQDSHAGTTPMTMRRDALLGVAQIIQGVNLIAQAHKPHGVGTVGMVQVSPNSRNVIPGSVFFTVDMRHPDDAALTAMKAELEATVERVTAEMGLTHDLHEIWYNPPTPFDPACIASVRKAAEEAGYAHRDIVSGRDTTQAISAKLRPRR